MTGTFGNISQLARADGPVFFMGICELCGDYDHVAETETGQTVCSWCQKNKEIGTWKNKRLIRAIKREAENDGSA